MKKGLMLFVLFLLIVASIYLYKKNLKISPNLPFQNQKTEVMQAPVKEEESEIKEVSQGLSLEVYEPKDNEVVNKPNLTIRGKTSPLAEVFVNEKELKADPQGNFSTVLSLDEGENVITVAASDVQGNYAEKELAVTLETVE